MQKIISNTKLLSKDYWKILLKINIKIWKFPNFLVKFKKN